MIGRPRLAGEGGPVIALLRHPALDRLAIYHYGRWRGKEGVTPSNHTDQSDAKHQASNCQDLPLQHVFSASEYRRTAPARVNRTQTRESDSKMVADIH
jgi:hypothetical protein